MRTAERITVYSAIACPYSHRTRMVLAIKGLPFETVEVDLLKPPEWFTAGPARTQMPRLETGEGVFHGAAVVGEYIDERWPEPALLPGAAAERAWAREWIDWLEEKLQPAYEAALLEIDEPKFAELAVRLEAVLRGLEERLRRHRERRGAGAAQRFWHGERLGMVDLTYAPSLLRFAGLRRFHAWKLPEGLDAVAAWIDALAAEPLVRESFQEEAVLRQVGAYLDNFRARAAALAQGPGLA